MGDLRFAKTVNDLDNFLPKSRGDCFDYGSWYGCDVNCPQLQRGECDGDIGVILESLEPDEVDELYEKGFYKDDIEKLRAENPDIYNIEVGCKNETRCI